MNYQKLSKAVILSVTTLIDFIQVLIVLLLNLFTYTISKNLKRLLFLFLI